MNPMGVELDMNGTEIVTAGMGGGNAAADGVDIHTTERSA